MNSHVDVNDPRYRDAAVAFLRRHDNSEVEANIASAERDFFILTGLANPDGIIEDNPPTSESLRAVDLCARSCLRRIVSPNWFPEIELKLGDQNGIPDGF